MHAEKSISLDAMSSSLGSQCELRCSWDLYDSNWDEFLAKVPGGNHVQSSMWAQVKSFLKWKTVRIVATQRNQIVAGAQLLIRSITPLLTVAYLTKGPVAREEAMSIVDPIIRYAIHISQEHHVRLLAIQPPSNGQEITSLLTARGFRSSSLELAPSASVVLDLSPTLEQILAGMKRQTRQNIRRSEQSGIRAREGKQSDLNIFYQFHIATSQRQKFFPYSKEYYCNMWRVFEPNGCIGLQIAEHANKPISALLLIPFGDTVIAKILGWSGEHADLRPNDAVFWSAIKWSKAHGYRFFDFEGIDVQGAKALLAGESLPEHLQHSPDFFKLGYGGQVVLYPQSQEILDPPLLKWIYKRLDPKVGGLSTASRLMDRLRKI
jgi:peptidoglycan pentaglycine glycine transferase (the first glycine)